MVGQSKNKNILFITHQLSRTGAPIVLLDMIKIFWQQKYEIEVITLLDGELRQELEELQIPVMVQERFMDQMDIFFEYVEKFNIVVANTLVVFEPVHLLKYMKIPVVWWIHEGRQYFEYFKMVLPDFKSLPSHIHVFSVGQYVQQIIEELYGIRTDILHFGVEDRAIEMKRSRGDKVRFLTAGTYSKVKGQDILVEAIRILPDRYLQMTEFFFCGNEQMCDETIFSPVRTLCEEYGNVTILHQLSREETLQWMEQCDCLIVPSRIDPVPTVAVEMMMKRNLCLCTQVCGIAHYIEDGVNGFTIPVEDPEDRKSVV